MTNFVARTPQRHRTLVFASVNHVWSDLFYAMLIPLLPLMKEDPELGLSFTEAGLLRTVHSGASAALQVPFGFLAERTGEFWLLLGGNVWAAAGLVAISAASTFPLLFTATLVGGLGGGTQHPLASSMVSRAYEGGARSTAVGAVNTAGDLGKMGAPAIAWLVAIPLGWRATFRAVGITAVVFLLLSTLSRAAVREPRQHRGPTEGPEDGDGRVRMGGFLNLSMLGFLDSGARGAALTFLPFLMRDRGMGTEQIFGLLFLLLAGGAIGKLALGWLDERHGPVVLIWATKGTTVLLLIAALWAPTVALAPLMLALGIGLNGTSSVLYANVAVFVPPARRARLYGSYYTTSELGGAIAPALYGVLADVINIRATLLAMALITALILPASLTLRAHLRPVALSSSGEATH